MSRSFREALPYVREWTTGPSGCPFVVGSLLGCSVVDGRPYRMSGTPSKMSGTPSRMSGSGQETLPELRE